MKTPLHHYKAKIESQSIIDGILGIGICAMIIVWGYGLLLLFKN